jgi:aminopeptidase N
MTLSWLVIAALAGPDGYMPDRHFDVQHLHLELTVLPEQREIMGTATHTVAPLGAPSKLLHLHQQGLEIRAVRVNGSEVAWRRAHGALAIPMPLEGETHEVAVDYRTSPELGLHFRLPGKDSPDTNVEVWSQGQDHDNRYWIPSWDYPNDRFTYSASLTVPEELTVATNGTRTGGEASDRPGFKTETFALEQELPTYLIALVVGDYSVYTDTSDGVALEYLVPAAVPEAHARTAGGFAAPQIAYFNDLLGTPYAWPIYRQAFVQRFMYGGMENTSLTINSDSVLGLSEVSKERAEGLVAHELAHQWFGDLVTCYGWRDRWLNEGFATMYASRWTEEAHGRTYYDHEVHRRMKSASEYTTPMARRSWSPEGPDSTGVYDRGMMVLHMLRTHLGDEIYDAGIRLYLERHAHQFVESADLRRALEDVSGRHLGWVFDRWVHDAGAPELSTSWSHSGNQLTVDIEQAGDVPWPAPIEIEVGTPTETLTRTVWMDGSSTRMALDLPEAPLYVAVDPRGGVLAKWSHEQPPEAWVAQVTHSPTPFARLVAAEHLGEGEATDEAVAALSALLLGEGHPKYRAVAADALGKLATPETTEVLGKGLQDPDERIRSASTRALARAGAIDGTLALLRRAWQDDSPSVRGESLKALAAVDDRVGLAIARGALRRPDPSRRRWVHEGALEVLAQHGDRSDLAAIGAMLDAKTPSGVLYSAFWAASQRIEDLDSRDERDRMRSKLSRRLEPLLDNEDHRMRQAAIYGLRELGDDRARSSLLALAGTTTVERLRESARGAARAIRLREEPPAEVPAEAGPDAEVIDQRLEEIEERLRRLEERR